MTTFTLPIRGKMPDGYGSEPVATGYDGETKIGGVSRGYVPTVMPVTYSFSDWGIATGTPSVTKSVVLPAGTILHDISVDSKVAMAGTSIATVTFNAGLGAGVNTIMNNVDLVALGRKDFRFAGVSAGVSLMGSPFTTDTTVNFTVSVSGITTQTPGPLSAGRFTVNVILG